MKTDFERVESDELYAARCEIAMLQEHVRELLPWAVLGSGLVLKDSSFNAERKAAAERVHGRIIAFMYGRWSK